MDERIHRFLIPILVALCIVSVSLTLSAPVFAADPWSPDVEFGTNVSDSSMREYRDRISATYKFILSMAAPFALVTITVGGLIAFLGSEKDAERGFSMIKMSLIALMALYFSSIQLVERGQMGPRTSRFYLVTAAEVEVK